MTDTSTVLVRVCLFVGFVELLFAATFVVRLARLPRSFYSLGLLTSCVLIFPSTTLLFMLFLHGDYGSPLMEAITFALLYTSVSAFVLSELEFLKLLAPFVPGISPVVVSRVQMGTSVVCAAVVLMSAAPLVPAIVNQLAVKNTRVVLAEGIAMYDLAQQIFLLHFVLVKLKGATVRFRLAYACIIVLGCVLAISALVIAVAVILPAGGSKSVDLWRLLMNLTVPGFLICAYESMELLRRSLQAASGQGQDAGRVPAWMVAHQIDMQGGDGCVEAHIHAGDGGSGGKAIIRTHESQVTLDHQPGQHGIRPDTFGRQKQHKAGNGSRSWTSLKTLPNGS
ncbi:hypothetical protein BC831DRAFT_442504 [Entophlyctis helioformis]|nr:hypothetical protein BC831DRAFT_442504 [Entophlyctis helioformis]